jgi:NTE family protein
MPEWVRKAIERPDPSSRIYRMASTIDQLRDSRAKPYVYLIDGAISDNLGLRSVIESIAGHGGMRTSLRRSGLHELRRVAFIIVDAQTRIQQGSLLGDIPGLGFVFGSSSSIMINRSNFDTIDLLRRFIHDWTDEDILAGRIPLNYYMVHVNFDYLKDKKQRDYLNDIPTTLSLSEKQVDKLREVAGRLLYESEDFLRLLSDLGAKIPPKVNSQTP